MKKCAFRLDDITADMNWQNFSRICSIFEQYEVKPLLGIVPKCLDKQLHKEKSRENFWVCMCNLQQKGYVVAQHGYTHLYETNNSGLLKLNPFSEFAGLPYEIQNEKIRDGKLILQKEGIYVTIFMAPGHTFDKNTLRALKENRFTHITDGYATKNYKRFGIVHVPSRRSKPGLGKGIDTICLHVNSMREADFIEVERFICENRAAVVNYKALMQEPVYRYSIFVWGEEQKNLLLRKIKKSVSQNTILHDYMKETASTNAKRAALSRIVGLPRLALRLVCNKRK